MKKKKLMGIMALIPFALCDLTLPVYAEVMEYQDADIDKEAEETSAECQVIYKATWDFSYEIPKLDVLVSGYEGMYDGKFHGINVDCKDDGATILYSTDGINYSSEKPEYKEPGTYVVYYKVLKDNCVVATGSSTVIIKAKDDAVNSNNQNNSNKNNKGQNNGNQSNSSADSGISNVQTGDESDILFYGLMFMVSAFGITRLKRREEKRIL